MIQDPKSGQLRPVDFQQLSDHIPELNKLDVILSSVSFDKPIDSSNMNPDIWVKLVNIIEINYKKYDGFVILHGSDTMAFTASALSFMLENLNKPVVLTGSQLPIGTIRTDGKENLITAIEIASARNNGKPMVPEVCIYFEYQLYRGNRTHKFNSEHFEAFQSANYPVLAEAGVHLKYNHAHIAKPSNKKLIVHTKLDPNIAILKIFPGMTESVLDAILGAKGLRAVILETYGSGNAPTEKWLLGSLKRAIDKGVIILNITQCNSGSVNQDKYETGAGLSKIGVIGGGDMVTEAAIAKFMFLLGKSKSKKEVERLMQVALRGEME